MHQFDPCTCMKYFRRWCEVMVHKGIFENHLQQWEPPRYHSFVKIIGNRKRGFSTSLASNKPKSSGHHARPSPRAYLPHGSRILTGYCSYFILSHYFRVHFRFSTLRQPANPSLHAIRDSITSLTMFSSTIYL